MASPRINGNVGQQAGWFAERSVGEGDRDLN